MTIATNSGAFRVSLLAHVAYQCDRIVPAPLSVCAADRSILVLSVADGRAHLCGAVIFTELLSNDAGDLAAEVARKLEEMQDLVIMETRERWPLPRDDGGRPECAVTDGVLRIAFVRSESKLRFDDFRVLGPGG